jgi:hypothetical protein
MIIEGAIEHYNFGCRSCGHTWADDYTVQYVEDSEGGVWSFYRFEGSPVPSPGAGDLICPACHHATVTGKLVGRQEIPLATLAGDEPRQRVSTTPEERREAAPELPGTVRLIRSQPSER